MFYNMKLKKFFGGNLMFIFIYFFLRGGSWLEAPDSFRISNEHCKYLHKAILLR